MNVHRWISQKEIEKKENANVKIKGFSEYFFENILEN